MLCVGLGLSIVMLLASNAWGHSPAPVLLLVTLHRHFPHQSQCGGWTGPCGSQYDQDTPQQQALGNFEKARFITHKSYMGTLGPHSEVRIGGECTDLGFYHYGG